MKVERCYNLKYTNFPKTFFERFVLNFSLNLSIGDKNCANLSHLPEQNDQH
jgi:hypothetical protein